MAGSWCLSRLPRCLLPCSMRLLGLPTSSLVQVLPTAFSFSLTRCWLQLVPRLLVYIMFFTCVCAAAAWPLALVNLKMIGYVSVAAAGIAASLVLYRVFVCVSAAAARPSGLTSVEVTDFAFPVRGLGVILKTGGSGACSAYACIVKFFLLFCGVLPRVAVGSGPPPPPPPPCEWDASYQLVPGFGYPALGFFFSAAVACIALAVVIMLWKCCSFCSGSRKEWKTERLSKLVEEKQIIPFSLQVASWFAAAVMESCNGVLAAPFRNSIVNDFVLKGYLHCRFCDGPYPEDKFVLPSGYVCYY